MNQESRLGRAMKEARKNTDDKPKKSVKKARRVSREFEFEAYRAWSQIPKQLRGAPAELVEEGGFDQAFAADLLAIRTKGGFAKRYKVAFSTLNEWDKKINIGTGENEARTWVQKVLPNVLTTVYLKALKNGDAERTRLLLQWGYGWSPNQPQPKPPTQPPVIVIRANSEGIKLDRLTSQVLTQWGPEPLQKAVERYQLEQSKTT